MLNTLGSNIQIVSLQKDSSTNSLSCEVNCTLPFGAASREEHNLAAGEEKVRREFTVSNIVPPRAFRVLDCNNSVYESVGVENMLET